MHRDFARTSKLLVRADVWLFSNFSAVMLPELVVFVVAAIEERIVSALHLLA